MAKALKTAALVVGAVALVATGVGAAAGAGLIGTAAAAGAAASTATFLGVTAGTFMAVGALAGVASSLLTLAAGLTAPKGSLGGSPTTFTIDKESGVPYAMGRTASAGRVVHRQWYGPDTRYESWVAVHSLGPIDGYEDFKVDNVPLSFVGSSPAGFYNGYMWLTSQVGACPEASALAGPFGAFPGWNTSSKLSGLAADLWTLRYDTKGKKYPTGVPKRQRVLRGVKVYDMRLDSTYPGGSGPCRLGDESTYVYSANPALHAVTFAHGRMQNGQLVAGGGLPVWGINLQPFADWANVCDANGWSVGGIVYSTADNKWDILKMIGQAGGGEVMPVGALLSCTFSAPRVSIGTITGDDIIGEIDVPSTARRRNRINGVIPKVRLETHGWEMTPLDVVRIEEYVTFDGGRRTREIEYPLVQDADQGAQLAIYDIMNARELDGATFPCKTYMIDYLPGDVLTVDIPEANLVDRDVLLRNREIDMGSLAVTFSARGETVEKHALALGATGTPPPTPDLSIPDPTPGPPDAEDWTATAQLEGGAWGTVASIAVSGEVGNAYADAVYFEYRATGVTNWTAATTGGPESTGTVISGLNPSLSYDVAISYRARDIIGDRLILPGLTFPGVLTTDEGEWLYVDGNLLTAG